MSMVYLWRYPHENVAEAVRRFDGLLARQATSLSSAFGRSFVHTSTGIGNVLVAQVEHADGNGVPAWRPWIDHGSCGIAWSGVCEDLLGVDLDEVETRKLHETARQNPERIGGLRGNFVMISWADAGDDVCITTGDTMSPPLWWTSGPDGWACGSRVAPLFDMVAAAPRFDAAGAALFLASSYHLSGGTFFAGTERIGTRQHVVIRRDGEPRPRPYLSVPDYLLAAGGDRAGLADAVRECADALVDRTGRQRRFSANPVLELSGGRDSRCIAAAIARGGGKVSAHTGGAPGSPEVRIAREVAEACGFDHSVETLEQDRLSVLLEHPAEARRWLRLSEGLESIRQGLHWERFFRGPLPVFETDSQFFHGTHFGMLKPRVDMTPKKLLSTLPNAVTDRTAARAVLEDVIATTDEATMAVLGRTGNAVAWANMYYWQRRCSIWGFNVMSTKYPIAWYWLPLVDKTLLQWSWRLIRDHAKPPPDFIDSITRHNAPEIASIEYVKALSPKRGLAQRVGKVLRGMRGRGVPARRTDSGMTFDAQYFSISAGRPEMWKRFFATNDHVWKDLVDERFVLELMERQPRSQFLWNLATAELVAQELF